MPPSDETTAPLPDPMQDLPEAARALLDTYSGPAIYLTGTKIKASNIPASMLLEREGNWWEQMLPWIKEGAQGSTTVRIQSETNPILVEWSTVTLAEGRQVLLGRNITLERNLQEALASSRDRFRDFVELTADLAWETNDKGIFTYIAGGRSLGYTPDDLLGKNAAELIIRQPLESDDYFSSDVRMEKIEAWLRRADSTAARVLISARPLRHADGSFRGARGLCRDITEDAARQAELALLQRRDQLIAQFVKSLREATEAKVALEIAAREISTSLSAAGCRIYHLNPEGQLQVAIESGSALPEVVNTYNRKLQQNPLALMHEELGSSALMGVSTLQGAVVNGAIWVWRQGHEPAWPKIDRNLLREVADHLGIVISQLDYQDRLRELSECDGLTKLLNRRTFIEKLEAGLNHSLDGSALFYLDLDNFKPVNDTHGHLRGDAVIRKVADSLRGFARPGDLAGRLGGDEFVLWADGLSQREAQNMAEKMVNSAHALREFSASPDRPLGVSVGVAYLAPGQHLTPARLLEKADSAMYTVKHGDKSGWMLAG